MINLKKTKEPFDKTNVNQVSSNKATPQPQPQPFDKP